MKMRNLFLVGVIIFMLLASCSNDLQPSPEPPHTSPTATPGEIIPADTQEPTRAPTLAPTDTPTAIPTPSGPRAMVSDVINLVDAHALPDGEWVEALEEMTIYLGGQVWAKEESTARVNLEDNLVRVAPNTIFTFMQPEANKVKIDLQQGQIWLNVTGLEAGDQLEVETPSAVTAVRGTRFSVRITPDNTTVVSSVDGQVDITAGGETITVTSGLQSTIEFNQPPRQPSAITIPEQMRWGMAAGPDLDVVVPVAVQSDEVGDLGSVYEASWSSDGDMFVFSATDSDGNLSSSPLFYDANAGELVDGPLPDDSWGAFFSPSGPGLAYDHLSPGGVEICILSDYRSATANAWPHNSSRLTALMASDPLTTTAADCIGGDGYAYGWPLWSPDGNWISYYTNNPGMVAANPFLFEVALGGSLPPAQGLSQLNIYKASVDGSEITQMTFLNQGYAHRQTWSPDGEQIAYVISPEYGEVGEVWIMNADGSDQTLIFEGINAGGFHHLAWSPDGQWLALPSEDGQLWLVNPDGSDAHPLPGPIDGSYHEIAWSPTESGWPMIYQYDSGEGIEVFYRLGDGQSPQLLGKGNWGPYWAPNGSRMALGKNTESDDISQAQVFFFSILDGLWQK